MRCPKCGRKLDSRHDEEVCADMALDRILGCPVCGTETAAHSRWCDYYQDGIDEDDEDEIDEPPF